MSAGVIRTLEAVGRALGLAREASEPTLLRGAVGEVLGAIGQLEQGTDAAQYMRVHLMWTCGLLDQVRDGQGALAQAERTGLLTHLLGMQGSLQISLPRDPTPPPPPIDYPADAAPDYVTDLAR